MRSAEEKLKSILYRRNCPSKMDLGEYEMGLLDFPQHNEIVLHEASCPLCQAELRELRQFMALPLSVEELKVAKREEKSSILDQIKIVVMDLLSPAAFPGLQPSLQPAFRGQEEDIFTRVIHVDSYIVALSAMKDLSSWKKQKIIGDISPVTNDEENFRDWTAYLWRQGRLLGTSEVDEDSHFAFEGVQIDTVPHELILSGPKIEILLQNLQMA